VFALGPRSGSEPGADLYHWHVTGTGQELLKVAAADYAVGRIVGVAADSGGGLAAYQRSAEIVTDDPAPVPPSATACIEQPRVLYAMHQASEGEGWEPPQRIDTKAPPLSTFATAIRHAGTTHLYEISQPGDLWELESVTGSAPWLAHRLAGDDTPHLSGSPVVSVAFDGRLQVHARGDDDDLFAFTRDAGGKWTMVDLGLTGAALLHDSPGALVDGVFWTGIDGRVRVHAGERVFADGFDGN
jgi:hypothetical protein